MTAKKTTHLFFFLSLIFWLISPASWAADAPAGQVILAVGKIQAIAANNAARNLQRGTPFFQSDTLITSTGSQAKLRFTDGTLLTLGPNTRLKIDSYNYGGGNNSYIVSLATGGFRTVTGAIAQSNPDDYKVRTPVATIAVRGTDYSATFTKAQGLITTVWAGEIELTNDSGKLIIGEQQKFNTAQIKNAFAIPEGLSKIPADMVRDPIIGATATTGKSLAEPPHEQPQETSHGLEKKPLLEICIP